jgi:hypothetical protein
MKKNLKLFFAGVLMSALCVGFMACNEPKDPQESEETEGIGVLPLPESEVPEEVSAFFKEQLTPALSDYFKEEGNYEPVVLMINSTKELKKIVSSSVELPNIDFDNHTLVVGQYRIAAGVYIKSHSVDTEPDIMKLNLVFEIFSENVLGIMNRMVYCNLYPKLPPKPITFNY